MVSRENKVIAACIALALLVLYVLSGTNTLSSSSASAAVLLGIGVLLPTLINEYLSRREGER